MKDLCFPGYVHFNYAPWVRIAIGRQTISRTFLPRAPSATRPAMSAMSPMRDSTRRSSESWHLGVDNIYAYTKPMCDRLKKELPALGYKLITPLDARSSIVVVQAKNLNAIEGKLRKAEYPGDHNRCESRPHLARAL